MSKFQFLPKDDRAVAENSFVLLKENQSYLNQMWILKLQKL